jgi:hypothetical protein
MFFQEKVTAGIVIEGKLLLLTGNILRNEFLRGFIFGLFIRKFCKSGIFDVFIILLGFGKFVFWGIGLRRG